MMLTSPVFVPTRGSLFPEALDMSPAPRRLCFPTTPAAVEPSSPATPPCDLQCEVTSILPTVRNHFVSCDTVAAMITGQILCGAPFLIVDCRYDYEHAGGHLPGAISINRHDHLKRLHDELRRVSERPAVIIFHCEFSQQRAPKSFAAFRALDRSANMYPALSFPQMFVMEGGYRKFFALHPTLCSPNGYVPMSHPELSKAWRKQAMECRKSWTKKKSQFREVDAVVVTPRAAPQKRFTFASPV
ncbi:protein-tyrosine-phosphatase [Plasmodiophora brassicae]|uniref:protein-tyrosine-phosphatase n=1 Tax=Plasmodiophora brassicae TaxID=37360 RepID=A0A0G4IGI0_PLABS|nr:hypothetical protein PBRA_000083 [Plasmodiophora brassicae]SPQ96652.1 unnamed protein product [Plasmodiophora brassicae]